MSVKLVTKILINDNDEDFNNECVMDHIYDNVLRFLFCIVKVGRCEPLRSYIQGMFEVDISKGCK